MTTGFVANFDTTFVSMANNTNIFQGNKISQNTFRQNSIINLCHNRPEINVSVSNLDNWKQIELRKLLLLTVVKKTRNK